jgi:tripartite ATP-independent transporter DctM subunit
MPVMTITLISICIVFFIIGVPIGVALGFASLLAVLIHKPVPSMMLLPQLFSEMSVSFPMLAVPLFILVGNLMERGSIGKKLINWVTSFSGWMTGGLGVVNVVASMIFGGISGSSLADTATFGTILVPRMVDEGYSSEYSGAITLTSSCLSVIIPPSILMVLAAAACNQSASRALAAGVFPGILVTAMLLIPNYFICKKMKYGKYHPFVFGNFLRQTFSSLPALLAPIIVLASIFSGFVTPTEGAGIAVLYILVVDGAVLRNLQIKDIWRALKTSSIQTSCILFIATSSAIMNYVISVEGIPQMFLRFLTAVPGGKAGFLAVTILLMVIIGMTMDASPASIIFTPLFLPAALRLGIDPSHYIVVIIMGLALGLTTPPYGVCIFSTAAITGIPIAKLVRSSIPFYVMLLLAFILIAYAPGISLLGPWLFGM